MMVMASPRPTRASPAWLAILIGIALAVAAGFLNGILVTRVGLPPFIVTLGTLSIFTAIALLYVPAVEHPEQPAARPHQLDR